MAILRAAALKDFRASALSTSVTTGVGYDLGPLTASQRLAGFFHLTGEYNSTSRVLVAALQSATSSGFTTPTTRFTFGLSTAVGSTWPAPIAVSTDHAYFRASLTMSTAAPATTGGTWAGLIGMGIQ